SRRGLVTATSPHFPIFRDFVLSCYRDSAFRLPSLRIFPGPSIRGTLSFVVIGEDPAPISEARHASFASHCRARWTRRAGGRRLRQHSRGLLLLLGQERRHPAAGAEGVPDVGPRREDGDVHRP